MIKKNLSFEKSQYYYKKSCFSYPKDLVNANLKLLPNYVDYRVESR